MPEKERPEGFDLVNVEFRFGRETMEEYWERYRQRYFEVYGEYPETPPGLTEEIDNPGLPPK